jgi:FkbM family methyltransferase
MKLATVCDHTFIDSIIGNKSIVLDLGANRCSFANHMISTYGAEVIAVEPNPALVAKWDDNPRLTAVNKAVGENKDQTPFYITRNSESSSIDKPETADVLREIRVDCVTLQQLFEICNIGTVDLLKIDIEGSEIEMLKNAPDELLKSIPQITVEFHDFNGRVSKTEVRRVIERLTRLNFGYISLWMRSYGDVLFFNREKVNVSALRHLYVRTVFKTGRWIRGKVRRTV